MSSKQPRINKALLSQQTTQRVPEPAMSNIMSTAQTQRDESPEVKHSINRVLKGKSSKRYDTFYLDRDVFNTLHDLVDKSKEDGFKSPKSEIANAALRLYFSKNGIEILSSD